MRVLSLIKRDLFFLIQYPVSLDTLFTVTSKLVTIKIHYAQDHQDSQCPSVPVACTECGRKDIPRSQVSKLMFTSTFCIKPTENPTTPKTVHLTAVPESKFILFLAPIGFFSWFSVLASSSSKKIIQIPI